MKTLNHVSGDNGNASCGRSERTCMESTTAWRIYM
jgi:hypothetical protein